MRDESIDSLDLTRGINQVLDGELAPKGAAGVHVLGAMASQVKTSRSAWYKPLTSVAVAASVTLAVLLGVQLIEPNDGLGLAANGDNSLSLQQGELTASTLTIEEQQQLENAQNQLQDYNLQNSAESNEEKKGILPFARVVEFQSQGK